MAGADPRPGPVRQGLGLTTAEVDRRVAEGRVNVAVDTTSRSLGSIVRANVVTLFNLILGIALVLVLVAGDLRDAVFGIVLVLNTAIGVVGEYRAKRTLDRLAILHATQAVVVRDGREVEVPLAAIVQDDVLLLATGDQVPADATVLEAAGLELDESLLTGESEEVDKPPGSEVLSGSVVVAGHGVVRVTRVGTEGYANRLTAAARRYSLVTSELRAGINKVLLVVSWIIVPITLLLFWSQLQHHGGLTQSVADGTWRAAVVFAVAGVVGMVPEGLVLLTSVNFALAAVVLARSQVLVQELPAVEVLARVDVLCLDKTGTLTDGTIVLESIDILAESAGAWPALAAFSADEAANATAAAIRPGLGAQDPAEVLAAVPFSSVRKWSAVRTASDCWVLGAPEVLLTDRADAAASAALARVSARTREGLRVVLLASAPTGLPDPAQRLPRDLEPVALAVLREQVRPDAAETLAYFRAQGVRVMVVSGDNPATVAAIARVVDLAGTGGPVTGLDARTLPTTVDDDAGLDRLAAALRGQSVLGRVMPEQKRAIVRALQRDGHTVAMTGDGVNDTLALKDADLGIAMGNGAGATKAVARLVLLDGRFANLPGVVAQGRRVMANMERVSNLFLTKTTYAALLAITVVVLAWPYPYLPRHLTLVGALTIGTPAFILALAPNRRRYVPGFLRRVLGFAVPAGTIAAAAVMSVYAPLHLQGVEGQARTAATMVLLAVGLWVLGVLARPWSAWRVLLVLAMASAAAGAFAVAAVREFFALEVPTRTTGLLVLAVGAVACMLVEAAHRLSGTRRDTVVTGPRVDVPVPVGARPSGGSGGRTARVPDRGGSTARRRASHRTVRRSPREHT